MSWLIIALIAAAALLAPLFGADTRDGRDWAQSDLPAGLRSIASR
ncbi:hypothetical protein Sme01_24750 [Sphaerisporangium melleum]|uniref:Uncharacterized protein n=1 Tax=Sphaerisporangium melleum TaxID=321316 RepID=A0A917VDF2_9ACTN|nr:hypothetical protein [Sphaerisporangium melleum]GGK65106.1 hypothetical protein GCM10007964_05180 [Sphaerisporangium melleum]GII69999.1 hypothetical protein Sme01_24750 [Sphaerisporangium melleum]